MIKRVMVDMSATLIHHGHIRLLKNASEFGKVVVGLTTDAEIRKKKGYEVELAFKHRKEILESIECVCEVVATPWLITEDVLDKHDIDLLVHGDDNSNVISEDRLLVLPRTPDVSSSEIRYNALRSITQQKNEKLMLTPGPAAVPYENLTGLKPLFGRGDEEYTSILERVLTWIKRLSGQDEVISMQGSATFALELAAHSFVTGRVLLVSTGYYSDRLEKLLPNGCELTKCSYSELDRVSGRFDWVLCAYTETSVAFKVDLGLVKDKANEVGAKLYVDSTGSIGLEEDHHLADVTAFSSCKGLFGLTGACFIAFKSNLSYTSPDTFYFNLETQRDKMITGPYHAIASLHGVMGDHETFKRRVVSSKQTIMKKYQAIVREGNQPLLCTYLEGEVVKRDENIVLYSPRSNLSGSVVCHFGEIHTDAIAIDKRISIKSNRSK